MATADVAEGLDGGTHVGGLRRELVEIGRTWASSQHRLVQLSAELDRSGEWKVDGFTSCAHWIAGALDVKVSTVREWIRVGSALCSLHVVDEAFAAGRLSFSKVRSLTRVATPETERELITLAESVPAGELSRALATWRAGRESPADTDRRQRRDRRLSTWVDVDGMVCGYFRLPPLSGGALMSAVDAEVMRRNPAREVRDDATAVASSLAQQRADALTRIVTEGDAQATYEVIVHVRGDGCSLDDGTPVAGSVVERIAPASFLRVLIHDAEGRPINASGRQRHPTTRQKRVVKERHRRCVDCGSTDLLHYDHVPEFATSGRTVIDEIEPRCAPCHRKRHENGP